MTYPSPKHLEEMYAKRQRDVGAFAAQESIQASDLDGLDRLGRCAVASDHWLKCLPEARTALLNDGHHFVRSCADVSARRHP